MGYAERVLQPGETVAYRARLHWIVYLGGLLFVAAAIALAIAAAVLKGDAVRTGLLAAAALLLLLGLWRLGRAWIAAANTEVVVTSRRLIYKVGFLSRSTVEMNLDKVESVLVRQGLMGRLLDFGSVIVRGVGAGLEPIPNIAQPLQLHRYVCGPGGARAEVAS